MNYLWVSRFFALALILGSIGGVLISVLTVSQLTHKNLIDIFADVAFTGLYVLAGVIGVTLWRNRNYGKIWATILFALQVPVISSPPFSYEWFTGIAVKFVRTNGILDWSLELGGSNNFLLQSVSIEMYGINVFAIGALTYLLIARYFKVRMN